MPAFADYVRRKAHRLPVDSRLYCDGEGATLVDRIYEFRRLPEALADLRRRLGLTLPEPLPREKGAIARDRRPYTEYYDEESRAQVGRLFAREIELMGYRFGD